MSMKSENIGVVWYKYSDLRRHDHAPFFRAHTDLSISNVHHVFVFNENDYVTKDRYTLESDVEEKHDYTSNSSSERCSFRRFKFLCECVRDMQQFFSNKNHALDVLIGNPAEILAKYAHFTTNERQVSYFYHEETTSEEISIITELRNILQSNHRVNFQEFWGNTLIDKTNLPVPVFELEHFTQFRKRIEENDLLNAKNCVMVPCPIALKSRTSDYQCIDSEYNSIIFHSENEVFHSQIWKLWQTLKLKMTSRVDVLESSSLSNIENELSIHDKSAFPFFGGETAALFRIQTYICNGIGKVSVYKETRNGMIGTEYSTKLSPYLATGCISPKAILHAIKDFENRTGIQNESTYWVLFELLWRDYMRYYSIKWGNKLFHLGGPQGVIGKQKHPWGRNKDLFDKWVAGKTGYPLIDANMIELMCTGYMSNRGRQIVASFLVRDMGQDWRLGAKYFEKMLLDYDPCSNYGNWQYSAGVGSDPRDDRYFNIIKQGHMYDPNCEYVLTWLPHLKHIPKDILLNPHLITNDIRQTFNISFDDLPERIVPLLHAEFKSITKSISNKSKVSTKKTDQSNAKDMQTKDDDSTDADLKPKGLSKSQKKMINKITSHGSIPAISNILQSSTISNAAEN